MTLLSHLLSGLRSPAQAVRAESPASPLLRPSASSFKSVAPGVSCGARSPLVTAWQRLKGWFSHSAVSTFTSLARIRASRPVTLAEARERLRTGRSLAHRTVQGEIEVSGPALQELHELSRAGAGLGEMTAKEPLRTEEQILLLADWRPAGRGLRMDTLCIELDVSTAEKALGSKLLRLHEAGADLRGVRLSGEVVLNQTGTLPAWISSLKEAGVDFSSAELTGSLSCRRPEALARALELGAGMSLSRVACNGVLTDPAPEALALIGRALEAGMQMDGLIVIGFPPDPENGSLRHKLLAAGIRLK